MKPLEPAHVPVFIENGGVVADYADVPIDELISEEQLCEQYASEVPDGR